MRASAIVLAGGASRRMGRDKALLRFGGQPVLARTVHEVAAVADEVIIAARGRPVQQLTEMDVRCVMDFPGAAGPLAGLAAGLAAASHATTLLVACDMPLLNRQLLGYLLKSLDESDAAIPVGGGRPQPLHAVYHRRSLPTIEALLRRGEWSFRALLPRLSVKYVSEAHCREIDPTGVSWFNMNRPGEYALARRLIKQAHRARDAANS